MKKNRTHSDISARHRWMCLIAISIIFAGPACLTADDKTQAAISASESWLQLVDNGRYVQSWKTAADLFQKAVGKKQWPNALTVARKPLGKVLSRDLTSAQYHQSLPGAPDGEYVVIRYQSRFTHKNSAVETITSIKEKDGQWRVGGYYIQ